MGCDSRRYIFGYFGCRDIEAEVQTVAESKIQAEHSSRACAVLIVVALCSVGSLNVSYADLIVSLACIAFLLCRACKLDVFLCAGFGSVHLEKQIADVGNQILCRIETADLHYFLVDCVDKVGIELQQEFLRRDVDHEVRIVLHGLFDSCDIALACRACACCRRIFGVEELAEYAFEQSVEIESRDGNLCRIAEDAAEVNIQCVVDKVYAEELLAYRRAACAFCVFIEFESKFDFEGVYIDVCGKIEREERTEVVAEFVDDVEFERRSADCAVGADKSHNHIEDFAQIDNVCVACFAAAVQRYVNGHFKMCGCVLQSHVIRI